MRRKALLSIILSAVMILGSVSSAFAAGQIPSNEVTADMETSVSESQDEIGTEQQDFDDSTVNSAQESADTQGTAEEEGEIGTEAGTEEIDTVEEDLGGESKTETDSTDENKADSAEEEEEKPEPLVGAEGARVSVGENVTAGFDSATGTVTIYSQGGTLSKNWKNMVSTGGNKILKITISNDSDVLYLPADSSSLFSSPSLRSVNLSKADTSNVTNMYRMFYECGSLHSLDVSWFDTSNVTNMAEMFSNSGLRTLDVSEFDTSNVTDMSRMFLSCSSLQSLDVSGFNTSNVTNMSEMFSNCSSLQTLDVSRFDTSNVTNMGRVFSDCSKLQILDVSGFNTSNVTSMNYMFNNCSSLQTLDVSGFDTSNTNYMSFMFNGCSNLQTLDVSGFDTSNVTSMNYMFNGCSGLQEIDVSNFDVSNVYEMVYMFSACHSLQRLDLSSFDMDWVNNSNCLLYSGGGSELLVILTPFNVQKEIRLPYTFVDESGTEYDSLPQGLSESIRLIKKGADILEDVVIINSANVEFQGKIRLQFSFRFPESVLADEGAYMTFEKAGTTTKQLVSQGTANGDTVSFIIPVPAPEYADEIVVKVFDGGDRQLTLKSAKWTDYTETGFAYSVKTYAKNKSQNGSTKKMRALAKALDDYGTASQIYFNYGDVSGLSVDSAVSAVTPDILAPYALTTTGTKPDGVTGANITVAFDTDNTLRIIFKTDGSKPLSSYTFQLDGTDTTPNEEGRNACLQVTNIAAPNLDTPHTFTVTDGTDTYTVTASALSYAYTSVKNGDSARQNLGKALYLYNRAADAYFGS